MQMKKPKKGRGFLKLSWSRQRPTLSHSSQLKEVCKAINVSMSGNKTAVFQWIQDLGHQKPEYCCL